MIYSYSKMKDWLTCPRMFHGKHVLGYKTPPSPALDRGNAIHQGLERAIQHGEPPPCWTPDGLLALLGRGDAMPEKKLAVDASWQPVAFFSNLPRLRGAIDVALVSGRDALLIDWKTGKFHPDPLQGDVYAALARAEWGSNLRVSFVWVYVDLKRVHAETVDTGAEERVQTLMDQIDADTQYAPRPCFACKFCPVKECEYHEERS